MPVKVLKNEGRELRIRVLDGNHTALQMFRSRLNDRDDVEYANYFQNHPDLDDPELYVRSVKGKKADKILKEHMLRRSLRNSPASSFEGVIP